MSAPVTTVYTPTPPPAGPATAPVEELSEKQQEMLKAVLEHFSAESYALPGVEKGELIEEEKFWLSRECLLRYLRATKWEKAAAAIERLEGTLKWKREFGFYEGKLAPDHIEPEQTTGKQILYGYDVDRRPGYYMLPSRQNTEESMRQVEHAVFMMEKAIDSMGAGVETLALLIDYGDKGKSPSLAQSRRVLTIIQTHYPERLGRALILNVPWALSMFYKLISPFIDPVTREKMRFNPKAVDDGLFKPDQLVKNWGGSVEIVYEHDKFWPALVSSTEGRKKQWMERWRALGGTIGIKEWDYKHETAT